MNKPENVRLEIFSFELKPSKNNEDEVSFKDLFIKRIEGNNYTLIDSAIFNNYAQFIFNKIDSEYKIVKNKAFTLTNNNEEYGFDSVNQIIWGTLDGGPKGNGKTKSPLTNKNDQEDLSGNVINDKYFFLIYTPLNSKIGYIFFQIYSIESIRTEFINFIFDEVFALENAYNPSFPRPVTPQSVIDSFQANSTVKEISFTKNIISSDITSDRRFTVIEDSYNIEINIKPKKGKVDRQQIPIIDQVLKNISFLNYNLDLFKKKAVLKNKVTKKTSTYVLDGIQDIQPRIYLLNHGISINEETGIPDFIQLKAFCLDLMQELISSRNNLNRN